MAHRKPVFGLIFLFQYLPGAEQVDEDEDASEVWFANQVHGLHAT